MLYPKVSIVIPVYNGSNYLSDAIDSALAQTYPNCEVIIVNDGSNDGGATERICLSYGDRIKYVKKENGGVASAINAGVKNMHGDYFAWLSHDDIFEKNKIDRQIDILKERKAKDSVIFGNFTFWNMNINHKSVFCIEDYCNERKIEDGVYPILFGLIHFCTMLVPMKRIEEVGLCDENLKTTQDIEWIFRLLRGKRNIFCSEPLTIVRLHEEQGKHHIAEYDEEQGITHISFMQKISEQEIVELFGNRDSYYSEMEKFYQRDRNVRALEYLHKIMKGR